MERTMKKFLIILCSSFLFGCVSHDINTYTPDVQANGPNYAADLSACRQTVIAEQDQGEVAATAIIPIYGMFKAFDTSDPSTYYGRRKAVDNCMKAKGYVAESGS